MAHSWGGRLDFDDLMCEKKVLKGSMFANPLYCKSKLANALFNVELSKRLEGTGIRTYALCPGVVSTVLGKNLKGPVIWMLTLVSSIIHYLIKTPQEGAATTMYCALSKNLMSESGCMYQNCGAWDEKDRITLLDEDARRLWEESTKLVKAYL